jgi:hypothetical protein
MDQRIRRLITMGALALICLVLVTAPVPAAPRDPLRAASIALGAHRVTKLHLHGFGATYAPRGPRVPLPSYTADVDVAVDAAPEQIAMTPQGFLVAARASNATVRAVPMGAEVSFTTRGRTFIGVITPGNEVDRVMTWVGGQGTGDTLVETRFRDYEKAADGVWFPTHITQNRNGYPSLDVWLSSVTADGRQAKGGRP